MRTAVRGTGRVRRALGRAGARPGTWANAIIIALVARPGDDECRILVELADLAAWPRFRKHCHNTIAYLVRGWAERKL